MKSDKKNNFRIFGHAEYIKASDEAPSFSYTDPLPLFRKVICLEKPFRKAELTVQAPGFATFYINGNKITDDIFISATSDYDKILWYNTYDVTALLQQGVNVLGAVLQHRKCKALCALAADAGQAGKFFRQDIQCFDTGHIRKDRGSRQGRPYRAGSCCP